MQQNFAEKKVMNFKNLNKIPAVTNEQLKCLCPCIIDIESNYSTVVNA